MDDEKHAEVTYDPTASNQDPFFTIVAPNLDGISRNSFQRGSVSRRRIIRAGILVVAILAGIAVITVIGGLFASVG
ncbi:hypothetical protein [Lacisediminihabitans sp.]|jgi:hypothetical protein|uniref:hypothetical protein n=1 Tax=Lacisediminihabitans sp. TaxID=2787631 RepID=UPI002F950975